MRLLLAILLLVGSVSAELPMKIDTTHEVVGKMVDSTKVDICGNPMMPPIYRWKYFVVDKINTTIDTTYYLTPEQVLKLEGNFFIGWTPRAGQFECIDIDGYSRGHYKIRGYNPPAVKKKDNPIVDSLKDCGWVEIKSGEPYCLPSHKKECK